jgi:hypothetical protein
MFAMSGTTEQSATATDRRCTSRAQRTQHSSARMTSRQATCGMWATASILLHQTGVSASVSLFVLLVILCVLLLVDLLRGLVSLSGLTGLIRSLVGLLTTGLIQGMNAGD